MLTLLLGVGGSQVWAETTTTYTFTSKSWAAKSGGSTANWTSGKDGNALTSGRGIQVTTGASGANATSPISFTNVTEVVVTYSTNAKDGEGTIGIKIGSNPILNKAVTKTDGTTDRTLDYSFSPAQSGNVQITVECTTNSIYVKSVAITYQTPVSSVSLDKTSTTLEVGDEATLTASITPSNADNKKVSWSSSNNDVATVNNGTITAVAKGTATITVTTEDGSKTATCEVTVKAATKTAVNITDFSVSAASATLVKGNTTTTTVANDQPGWTAAYKYSSSNPDVATVDANGVIEAVAKGTATITCSLNVDLSDPSYKAGTTTSKTIEITVKNPSHIVTFSSNGSTYGEPASVEEGESITLPAENPKEVNGYTFRGWKDGTIDGTTDEEPTYVTSPVMGDADVTYYAVFAEVVKGNITTKTDKLTNETTGITGTNYGTWEYESNISDAVYAGNSAGGYSSIQLRSTDNSGIVTTQSGGKVTKIEVEWNSNTTRGRTLNVYGRDDAYTGVVLLYSNADPIGTITYGTSTELEIPAGYKYIGIRSENKALYLKSVSITWTTVTPDTYAHYCTTVSALPRPIITMEDVEMTWGDTDKSVAPSATVNDGDYDRDFTFTVDKEGLTVGADGKLTSNTPGTYVVTANIAATAEHQAASTTCTVTVGKQNVTLSFAETTVRKKTSDASYTQTATATPDTYDGTITYSKESASTSTGATVNTTTGAVDFSATGSVIVKATASATDLYNSAETTYTILIQSDPEILVEDESISYGKTFTVDDNVIEGGDITVTSSNPAVASVAGLVITSHAVGTTTITVKTEESDTYVEGEETFTLTVTAPEASSTNTAIFYESFDKSTGTDGWSSGAGNGTANFDNDGWEKEKGVYGGATCIKLASGNNAGAVTTPSITTTSGTTYTLTFKAGSWSGDGSTLTLSGTGTEMLSTNSIDLEDATFNEYTVTFKANSSSVTIKFSAASGKRLFLDEIKITETSTSVTTTGGLATYCYQYPLDLDDISGAKAYVVKDVDMEKGKVMLTQITGTIKGGVPFILKADGDDATFEIPLADESTTVPLGNLLVGTLAPTFVEQTSGDYTNFAYSKSNKCFVKLGEAGNTVPANRAYLPVKLSGNNQAKSFALTFDNADGIARTQIEGGEERVYNLAGQRLQKAQRGVNIINGRKVLVK